MAGGAELEQLTHELQQAGADDSELQHVAEALQHEVAELGVGHEQPAARDDTATP
jgi:hypothetical protein